MIVFRGDGCERLLWRYRASEQKAKGAGITVAVDAKVIDISACSWSDQRDDGSAEGEGSGGEGVEGHDGEVIVESPSGSG